MESSYHAHILFHLSFLNNYFCRCVYIKILGSFLQSPFLYHLEFSSPTAVWQSNITLNCKNSILFISIKMKNKGYYYPYMADIFSQLHWVDVSLTSWMNFWFQHELCCTLAILLLTKSWVSAGQLLSVHWLFFKEYWKIRLLVKYLHVFRWFTSHLLMERVKETRRFHPGT